MATKWAPRIGFIIDMPDPLMESDKFVRIHKRIAKKAAVTVLKAHQVKRLPRHFKTTARTEYNHYPRKESYKEAKKKRFGSITDLVKTGKLKAQVTKGFHRIQIGGDAINGLRARMLIAMPFPVGDDSPLKGVTVTAQMMIEEMERWSQKDYEEASAEYQVYYFTELADEIKNSPRWKKQIGATVEAKLK